ncbi:c-type cytochrome [Pendulispora albinea]|uniref:Cytochrome c n=1 Tax=Pendulispora albinea TaxID=2741071 RepID=A0ABZ2M3P3_9BACT
MRQTIWSLIFAAAATPALLVGACGGDDTSVRPATDGGLPDTSTKPDAAVDPLARGKYIVDTLASCGDCHTPRKSDGSPDMTKYLAGNSCFIGTDKSGDAGGPGPGCLSAPNLTNHADGLKNVTVDQEIKDMFQHGKRPDGKFLNSPMPYWVYANMTDADANAVVAYLRTVPGVANRPTPNQPPWTNVPAPTPPIDLNTVPAPEKEGNPDYESQMRGRYLAAVASACIECHTPEKEGAPPGQVDRSKWFAGKRAYDSKSLGLPQDKFPAQIFSANLTSDLSTGLGGYSLEQIVRVIKQGQDKDGKGICPPMPAGPRGSYVNMSDDDARDIARYLKSLPPIVNARTDCVAPGP